jgi:multimeric flavodoxin WrbA
LSDNSATPRRALGVIGSPRRAGNTANATRDVLEGLADAGFETEELHLCDHAIDAIDDCSACVAAGCCTLDDDLDQCMQRVYAADVLVLATPLYWYRPSGQLKVFLDRWSCLLDREEEAFRARMRDTPTAVVIAQGERGFYEAGPCLQMLEWTLRYLDMPLVSRIVTVGHARGDYASDAPQRQQVRAVGRRLAAAEPLDVLPPWFHVTHTPGEPLGGIYHP